MMNMQKERILVTVKTYPTLSKKYGETVCTAGVREDGSWVRIYPVPFRRPGESEQYRKYDWLECRLVRQKNDFRPDSFRPYDEADLQPAGHIDTNDMWLERRRIILDQSLVYDRLDEAITDAKANRISLCVFKPTKVKALIWEKEDPKWDPDKLREMRKIHSQLDMFDDNDWRKTFNVIPKLPYSFSYRFEDITGRQSELQILDWEIGMLYWNCLKSSGGNEDKALSKVRQKYFCDFLKTDLHFFLGTTQQYHAIAPNPYVIVGVFPIPRDNRRRFL